MTESADNNDKETGNTIQDLGQMNDVPAAAACPIVEAPTNAVGGSSPVSGRRSAGAA